MNSPSLFQQQHPLSAKKIWKKLIAQCIPFLFQSLMIGGFITIFSTMFFVEKFQNQNNAILAFVLSALGLTLAFFTVITFLYSIYIKAYIRRYYYDASEQFLTIQKGVFAPTEIHVPYGKIQDVYVDQDILDRIMGIYDVHIASATVTSGIEAHIDGVDPATAEALKNFLLNKIQYGSALLQQFPTTQNQPLPSSTLQGPQSGVFNSKNFPIDRKWLILIFSTNLWLSAIITFALWMFFLGRRVSYGGYVWLTALLIYLVVYLSLNVWMVLWRKVFYFELLPQFILVKDGVISREEKHVPYRTVQNVLLKRGIVERLLGLSTVIIENAAAGNAKTGQASRITIPGQPLEKGTELVNELNRILGQNTTTNGTGL